MAGLAALGALSQTDYVLFHTLAELVAIGVAWGVFIVAWNARHFTSSGFFVVLGCAYAYVAALDLVHTLAYNGLGLAKDGGNVATQLWMAARFLEGVMLIASFRFLHRPAPAVPVQLGLATVTALLLASILVMPVFPECFIPGSGLTPFKIAGEYVVIAAFVAGAVLVFVNRTAFAPEVWVCLLGYLGLRVLSELAFTTYAEVFDIANMAGHLLKVTAFYLFYRATISATLSRPYQVLFRDLNAAREALRFAEERFRLAIHPAPLLAFSQDLHLRYDWVFAGEPIVGRLPAVGEHDADFMRPEDAATITALKLSVLESGQGVRREIRLGRRGRRSYELSMVPLRDTHGAVVGIVGAGIEVTQLVKARAEAERANQAKSRFLAAASHDLRQPFQAMRLFYHALSNRITDPNCETLIGKMGEAMAAGENLLNALLDVSTLEAGTLHPRPTDFIIGDLLGSIAREVGPQAAQKGLRLRAVPCSVTVRSDPTLLGRMLRNLAANALRYTETGSILIGCRRQRTSVVVMVCDTGIGIAAEQLDSIFDDFYQIGNAERDRERGLGLGLSIVVRVGRLLEHPVSVRSAPGRGSTFSVRVPMVQYEPADRATAASIH